MSTRGGQPPRHGVRVGGAQWAREGLIIIIIISSSSSSSSCSSSSSSSSISSSSNTTTNNSTIIDMIDRMRRPALIHMYDCVIISIIATTNNSDTTNHSTNTNNLYC